MKKSIQILIMILGFLFILLVGGIFWLFLSLPGPLEIGKSIASPARKQKVVSQPQPSNSQTTAVSQELKGPAPVGPGANTSDQEGQIHLSAEQNFEILENLTDPLQKKTDVCANLKNYQLIPENTLYKKEALNRNFNDLFVSERKDPVLMALLAPLRLFLQQPQMKELLRMVVEAVKEKREDSLQSKAVFYSQVLRTYQEMEAQKGAAEALVDRGYHLFMMSKAVALHPNLLSDPQFMDYCRSIEEAANSAVPLDWRTEQAEFQRFLAAEKIEPSEIGYDPQYKTHLQFEKSDGGLRFHGGWLDSIFSPPPEKKN